MPIQMEINNALAIAICNSVVDALDVTTGATPPAPVCRIFSGAAPGASDYADAVDPAGALVNIPLETPAAFGAAADQNPNARATMDVTPTPSATPTASGTAASFRMRDRQQASPDTIWQGNVGTTGSTNDLELSSVSLDTGTAVQLTAWTVDALEGPGL